ncbi:adaptin ear-binding coat-associated protein 2-like [Arapaima gigas]
MAEETYESVICVKPEVHVYRIPPRATNRGYRAADWKLEEPAWSGRLRITAKGKVAFIKLEDKTSGELFAQAPVEQYPGSSVEAVTDSSRYFVVRIEDGNGRHAFIGLGFADRGDSFDFNVALQDHFKWVRQESELAKQEAAQSVAPKLDLGFKEGQTIKINIGNIKKKEQQSSGAAKSRPMGSGLLPPPPGVKGGTFQPPLGVAKPVAPAQTPTANLVDFEDSTSSAKPTPDLWGDFTTAASSSSKDVVQYDPTPANIHTGSSDLVHGAGVRCGRNLIRRSVMVTGLTRQALQIKCYRQNPGFQGICVSAVCLIMLSSCRATVQESPRLQDTWR